MEEAEQKDWGRRKRRKTRIFSSDMNSCGFPDTNPSDIYPPNIYLLLTNTARYLVSISCMETVKACGQNFSLSEWPHPIYQFILTSNKFNYIPTHLINCHSFIIWLKRVVSMASQPDLYRDGLTGLGALFTGILY